MTEIIQIVAQVVTPQNFPMIMSVLLLVKVVTTLDKLTAAVTEACTKICMLTKILKIDEGNEKPSKEGERKCVDSERLQRVL